MRTDDLAALADALRREGWEARNLGKVGITIWRNGEGRYYSAEDLGRFSSAIARRDFAVLWSTAEGD